MIQEKLKTLRKQKGISQEQMAKILHIDTSNYSRKERGEIRIHDEEWKKLADALDVPLEEIKENPEKISIKNENSTFNDNSGNCNQYYSIPNSIIENLHNYIALLKEQNELLKAENLKLKESSL